MKIVNCVLKARVLTELIKVGGKSVEMEGNGCYSKVRLVNSLSLPFTFYLCINGFHILYLVSLPKHNFMEGTVTNLSPSPSSFLYDKILGALC